MIRLVAALAGVLLAGCQGVTGPGNRAGPYVMTLLDSSALPHVLGSSAACDQLVSSGMLDLNTDESFLLRVAQIQDCSRAGGAIDSFTTTISGSFTLVGTSLTLQPVGTGLHYAGTVSSGAVQVHLPPLPLVGTGDHVAAFVKFPL